MYIRDIIMKKRRNEELTDEEIRFFVMGYFKEEISEAQAAALMTAIYIYGLSEKEMICLISAMAETGKELEFNKISSRIVDIHTLGGISDKIIIMLISVLNSVGVQAAKVIGRELGMEDRLISVSGYKITDNIDEFRQKLTDDGMGILKSIKNLAPVEEKLYKLRHEIACDNNINLITASIMSQKVALGFDNIFFEITYGDYAYIKTLPDAKTLAKYLVYIGKKINKNVCCCITKLDEPTGQCFGNIIELREIYKCLSGEMPKDVEETILEFGSKILNISKTCRDENKAKTMIKENIQNGEALKSFETLIKNNGGNFELLKEDIEVKNVLPITAPTDGYIAEINVNKLRMLAKFLGAIRNKRSDNLDIGAGIVYNKKVGDAVKAGEIIANVYTNSDIKTEKAISMANETIVISNKKVKKSERVKFELK